MNEPVKCPDCSTWWRGEEHRCPAVWTPLEKVDLGGTILTGGCTCVYEGARRVPQTAPCVVHDISVTYAGASNAGNYSLANAISPDANGATAIPRGVYHRA